MKRELKRPFLLITILLVILLLPKEAISEKIRVAILDFQDKSSPPKPQMRERIFKIFEDLTLRLDFLRVERELITSLQKNIEEPTPKVAKIMGKAMEADLVIMGEYKVEREEVFINSYFIDTGRRELKGIDGEIIRRIKEMEIKRFNVRSVEQVLLNIYMVLREEREERMLPSETYLFITSRPGNAKIYIDGKLQGLTPQAFIGLKPSLYRITLVKNGLRREETIILRRGARVELDIDLYEEIPILLPIVERVTPVKLFAIETPYAISKGRYHVSIDYPELLIFRYGILREGLETRIQGMGIGIKYKWGDIGSSILYRIRDLRKDEGENPKRHTLDIDILFSRPIDTLLGIFELYSGLGYRFLKDPGLRYFIGFETFLFPRGELLVEYDRFEGGGVGFRYLLPYNLSLTLGLGLTPKGRFRYEGNLSYTPQPPLS